MPSISIKLLLAIFLGGGVGSMLRFGISYLFKDVRLSQLPLATLVANILSCIVIGVVLSVYSDRLAQSDLLKALIIIGFCGGLSTFSTFSYETFSLLKNGQYLWAILNVLVSVTMCISVLYFFLKNNTI